MSDNKKMAGRVRRTCRKWREERCPGREMRDVKDSRKFIPKDLSNGASINEVKKILEGVLTERASGTPRGEMTNPGTKRKSIKIETII